MATVSKVMNNYPDVGQKPDKVNQVIKNVIFGKRRRPQPDNAKSYTIGIFFTDHFSTGLQHPFFHEVIFGMEKTLGEHGYDLCISPTVDGAKTSVIVRNENRRGWCSLIGVAG